MANKQKVTMLTTFDNPYDPFDQFEQWFLYDVQQGYNSCAYLARIANVSNLWSEELEKEVIEQAINEIISLDTLNLYTKVSREIEEKEEKIEEQDTEQI